MGGPDATPDRWKQPFSAARASGGYPGNVMRLRIIYVLIKLLPHQGSVSEHIEAETKWLPFPDDILKWIFLNENVWILIEISLKFVPRGPIYNIPALVQIMAWHWPGDKPLSEPMMVSLLTHICITRPQWLIKVDFVHISWSMHRR